MSERKYTKQELWMAFQGASSWKTFQEFFDQNFPPDEKMPFDAELEKHEQVGKDLGKVKEVYKKDEECIPDDENFKEALNHFKIFHRCETSSVGGERLPIQDREAFLGHLETALLIMKVNVPMNDVEKIVAIYNCVKEHGSKTSIADLREAIG